MKSSELQRRTPLRRETPLRGSGNGLSRASSPKPRSRAMSPASTAQRAKVQDKACVVCGRDRFETVIDPAHLASRAQGAGDDLLDIVALCREHHRGFDSGRISLLEHLEPRHREEVAQCVRRLGLIGALQRLTNARWRPE